MLLKLIRFTLAVLVLAAIGQQLIIHIRASYSVLNFFSYFTNLSNLFAALVLLLSVFTKKNQFQDLAIYIATVNMVIVGLVYAVLLRNVDLGALLPWVNTVLHIVMPIAMVLNWLVSPPASPLTGKHLLVSLVFPSVYLAYTLVRGASTGWYPYPFLNPANVGGYGAVAAYALAITTTFVLASGALLASGNRLSRARAVKH